MIRESAVLLLAVGLCLLPASAVAGKEGVVRKGTAAAPAKRTQARPAVAKDWPPPGWGKAKLPEDVKRHLQELVTARVQYLEQQKLQLREWKAASAEKRSILRQTMSERREKFLVKQKEKMEQVQRRIREIRAEFKNRRDRVLEAAKEQVGRGRGR